MHKKFEINGTKTKSSCQSGREVVAIDFKSDLPLVQLMFCYLKWLNKRRDSNSTQETDNKYFDGKLKIIGTLPTIVSHRTKM